MTIAADRPTSILELVTSTAKRSRCDLSRPRVDCAAEHRLEHVEAASAECYAELELLTYQFYAAAETIDDSAVPDTIDEDDSIVVHLEDAIRKTQAL